jgi:hypothetical protein
MLHSFSFGDVAYQSCEKAIAADADFTNGDLHCKGAAVLPLAQGLSLDAENPSFARRQVLADIRVVAAAIGLRHQHTDVSADNLCRFIAKHFGGTAAEGFDDTGTIDDDDAIDRAVHDDPQPLLVLPEFARPFLYPYLKVAVEQPELIFGLLLFGNIREDRYRSTVAGFSIVDKQVMTGTEVAFNGCIGFSVLFHPFAQPAVDVIPGFRNQARLGNRSRNILVSLAHYPKVRDAFVDIQESFVCHHQAVIGIEKNEALPKRVDGVREQDLVGLGASLAFLGGVLRHYYFRNVPGGSFNAYDMVIFVPSVADIGRAIDWTAILMADSRRGVPQRTIRSLQAAKELVVLGSIRQQTIL